MMPACCRQGVLEFKSNLSVWRPNIPIFQNSLCLCIESTNEIGLKIQDVKLRMGSNISCKTKSNGLYYFYYYE